MMVLEYNNQTQAVDLERDGNFTDSELLSTAVFISLFTRRLADEDDVLPDPRGHREGWWADDHTEHAGDKYGSRLWLLDRSTLSQDNLNKAKIYAEEALAWMVEDGIATSIVATAERMGSTAMKLTIDVEKPTQPATRWQGVWEAHLEQL